MFTSSLLYLKIFAVLLVQKKNQDEKSMRNFAVKFDSESMPFGDAVEVELLPVNLQHDPKLVGPLFQRHVRTQVFLGSKARHRSNHHHRHLCRDRRHDLGGHR